MDAVSLLNQHIDIEKLLIHYDFDQLKTDNNLIRACCKIHGGDNPSSFVANRDNNLWYCHTNCGGGDAYTLVQHMENVNFPTAVNWLANFFDVDITDLKIIERKPNYINDIKKWLTLMRKRKNTPLNAFHIEVPTKKVTKFRNFNPFTLDHFGLQYATSITLKKKNGEDYTLHNRLVFPIIFNNIQVGVALRKTKASDYPKWSNQPANINTSEFLYNYDNVLGKPKIVICEGITDVWAFYEINIPAVSTFGAHITEAQYKLLLKTGADLIFAFDGDTAGRTATEKAIKMFRNKANIEIIHFNDGEDPASISREELKKYFETRRKIQII